MLKQRCGDENLELVIKGIDAGANKKGVVCTVAEVLGAAGAGERNKVKKCSLAAAFGGKDR